MATDERSVAWRKLINKTLPHFMRQLKKSAADPISVSDLLTDVNKIQHFQPSGCYLLIEDKKPLYIGLSRHICEALRWHHIGFHSNLKPFATFQPTPLIDKIAAEAIPKGLSKKAYMQAYKAICDRIGKMNVATVYIDNDLISELFQIYCSVILDVEILARITDNTRRDS